MVSPDATDFLKLFAQYGTDVGKRDFGAAYLEPDDDRYRLLFEQLCRLLIKSSPFTARMPPEFRKTARLYLQGDRRTLEHMAQPEMRHFMLSDLYDYVQLCERLGQHAW